MKPGQGSERSDEATRDHMNAIVDAVFQGHGLDDDIAPEVIAQSLASLTGATAAILGAVIQATGDPTIITTFVQSLVELMLVPPIQMPVAQA